MLFDVSIHKFSTNRISQIRELYNFCSLDIRFEVESLYQYITRLFAMQNPEPRPLLGIVNHTNVRRIW